MIGRMPRWSWPTVIYSRTGNDVKHELAESRME